MLLYWKILDYCTMSKYVLQKHISFPLHNGKAPHKKDLLFKAFIRQEVTYNCVCSAKLTVSWPFEGIFGSTECTMDMLEAFSVF